MKLLRTKKVNVAICWNGLRNTPPKEFPNIGEIENTEQILKILEEAIPDFTEILKEGDKIADALRSTEDINDPEIVKQRKEFIEKSQKLEDTEGNEIVDIEFENSDFNTFFQQFERWGKNWFLKLGSFLEFRRDLNETNSHKGENIKK